MNHYIQTYDVSAVGLREHEGPGAGQKLWPGRENHGGSCLAFEVAIGFEETIVCLLRATRHSIFYSVAQPTRKAGVRTGSSQSRAGAIF